LASIFSEFRRKESLFQSPKLYRFITTIHYSSSNFFHHQILRKTLSRPCLFFCRVTKIIPKNWSSASGGFDLQIFVFANLYIFYRCNAIPNQKNLIKIPKHILRNTRRAIFSAFRNRKVFYKKFFRNIFSANFSM
jgi:hypothetical protein